MGRPLDPKIQTYHRADGTVAYRVRVRRGGRQTTETFDTPAAAEAFVRQCKDPNIGVERAIEMRSHQDQTSSAYIPTVREMLHKHVAGLTGVEDATREEYVKAAERSWLDRLGAFRVDELRRDDVARWVNSATGAPKTIKNQFVVLSATLNTAVYDGHIAANVARGIRLPRAGEEDVDDPNFLTHAEFDRLFAEFPERAHPLVVWLFGTGMRWSEATAQQPQDWALDAGLWDGGEWVAAPEARVVRAWKKGHKVGPPKSKAGRRTVVLDALTLSYAEPLLDGLARDAWVFRNLNGDEMRHANFYNSVWKPATMRASVCEEHRLPRCRCFSAHPERCTVHTAKDADGTRLLPEPCGCPGTLPIRPRIHDARHTHASWLIAQGVRLEVIQERLGHEDYLTTRRIYGHLMPDAQLDARRAAAVAFSRTALGGQRVLPGPPGHSST